MQRILSAASLLAITAGAATAGGIDRSGQGLGNLFEAGRTIELTLGSVSPSVQGTDTALGPFPGGGSSGNVASDFGRVGLSFKDDIGDKMSYAIIFDQPFGADILYGSGSFNLGGTRAYAKTAGVTGVLRYKFTENFSVHGGLRAQKAHGVIDLRGAAYGPFDGYSVDLDTDYGFGYLVGVTYEKPEIALRVSLTYNSEIKHEFDTVESFAGGAAVVGTDTTTVRTPQSVNLDAQTGIAKDTLLFGQIRWVDWSEFKIDPTFLTTNTGSGLIDLDDTVTYTLGVGRRFTENWSGSLSYTYEPSTGDDLVSPLAPTNGYHGITLAAVYTRDNIKVTTGVNYSWLGNAKAETGTPDQARANFDDNDSVGVGVRIAYTF